MGDGRLAIDLLWIWVVVGYAPPTPTGPIAIPGGVCCALVQEGRAGKVVLEIHPRHPGTVSLFGNKAALGGTCASPLETGVLYPSKKTCPVSFRAFGHPSPPAYFSLRRVVSFGVLVATPHLLLQQGSSCPGTAVS